MSIFNLPDLGEGLPDAEIHEWFVKEGDTVQVDQPLVAMETAKAVVEVPSPQAGIIAKLYGQPGDVLKTGSPLVAFVGEAKIDKGTVVGNLEESQEMSEDNFIIGGGQNTSSRIKATPAIRVLAKKWGIDLTTLKGTGAQGLITKADLEKAKDIGSQPPFGFEPLRGVRRGMFMSMVQSHKEVVPVSIFDEADIHDWSLESDITVRLIQAIVAATEVEPSLNAWFDTEHCARKCFAEVNLGLAMDTDEGLFVPVIHHVGNKSGESLRKQINQLKEEVKNRSIPSDQLKGATITLSNFGKFAGRFASPIIVPPMVAILAVGRVYEMVKSKNGHYVSCKTLPLSLSFDHRAVTGGEATRFLGEVIKNLERA